MRTFRQTLAKHLLEIFHCLDSLKVIVCFRQSRNKKGCSVIGMAGADTENAAQATAMSCDNLHGSFRNASADKGLAGSVAYDVGHQFTPSSMTASAIRSTAIFSIMSVNSASSDIPRFAANGRSICRISILTPIETDTCAPSL